MVQDLHINVNPRWLPQLIDFNQCKDGAGSVLQILKLKFNVVVANRYSHHILSGRHLGVLNEILNIIILKFICLFIRIPINLCLSRDYTSNKNIKTHQSKSIIHKHLKTKTSSNFNTSKTKHPAQTLQILQYKKTKKEKHSIK